MVTDFPIQAILDRLVHRIVDVLPITAAGVTLISPATHPRYVAASNESALRYEKIQSELGEGPCLAAYEAGKAVVVPDLHEDFRFPTFARRALEAGLVAVFTFPLRHGDEQLGALDLYRDTAGRLDATAMRAAQTLADVAAAYLLNAQSRAEARDPTERTDQRYGYTSALEALRDSEDRKAAILASSPDAVITLNHEGRIDELNPAAEQTFGFAATDVLGRKLADVVFPPDQRDARSRDINRLVMTGDGPLSGQWTELLAMRSDGTLFPAEIRIHAVDRPGPPLFTGVVRDITDRKSEEAVRRSLEHLLHQAQRLESIGQLASGVAEDLNDLLGVILNYASFVAKVVADDAEAKHDVEQILAATDRAVRLARQLLTSAHQGEDQGWSPSYSLKPTS
jgi:PAS domain S-box-containing protein